MFYDSLLSYILDISKLLSADFYWDDHVRIELIEHRAAHLKALKQKWIVEYQDLLINFKFPFSKLSEHGKKRPPLMSTLTHIYMYLCALGNKNSKLLWIND